MRIASHISCPLACATLAFGSAVAAQAPDESRSADRLEIKPILETRARYEHVDQGPIDADALTVRVRAGAEAIYGPLSLLAEGEATLAPLDRYNAFPFGLAGSRQWRPDRAVVADPENVELNRLQLQYRFDGGTLTAGRQRINLDDQRWVGSVGWRQNEQTFDALRAEGKMGSVTADVTYAVKQRSVFGTDAGPRSAYDGDFVLAGLSSGSGLVSGKLFAYLLDYDEAFFLANSSQTYGALATAAVPLARGVKLDLRASYARQSDYKRNPFDYSADYWAIEATAKTALVDVTAGAENLGSGNGRAVQTPMATLHKFNGWADVFLTTPADGLQDLYVSATARFGNVKPLPGLFANVGIHRFSAAAQRIDYGSELDSAVGFRLKAVSVLVKYAHYEADRFGTDTTKLWLQLEAAI